MSIRLFTRAMMLSHSEGERWRRSTIRDRVRARTSSCAASNPAHDRRAVNAVHRADAREREALDEDEAEQAPLAPRQADHRLAKGGDEVVLVAFAEELELGIRRRHDGAGQLVDLVGAGLAGSPGVQQVHRRADGGDAHPAAEGALSRVLANLRRPPGGAEEQLHQELLPGLDHELGGGAQAAEVDVQRVEERRVEGAEGLREALCARAGEEEIAGRSSARHAAGAGPPAPLAEVARERRRRGGSTPGQAARPAFREVSERRLERRVARPRRRRGWRLEARAVRAVEADARQAGSLTTARW